MIQRFAALHESLRFTRPPFYAALLWPLSLLPYKTAYPVWWLLRIASLGGFVALWRIPSRAETMLFTVLSLPVFASLAAGQDSILLLLFIAVAFRCWQNGNDFNAGLALSLCAIKFHLFVLLPLLFWRQRLGRMAAGFGSGAAALLAVSFAVEGWRWPFDYFAVLTDGRVHPSADSMPNLHGLFAGLPHGVYLEALASVAVVAAAWLDPAYRLVPVRHCADAARRAAAQLPQLPDGRSHPLAGIADRRGRHHSPLAQGRRRLTAFSAGGATADVSATVVPFDPGRPGGFLLRHGPRPAVRRPAPGGNEGTPATVPAGVRQTRRCP